MPTQKDAINGHFVRHVQTGNEIWQYKRLDFRGVATGVYGYIYPPPQKKSVQVNFLLGKYNVRTAIELYWSFIPPQKIYTPLQKKQISGYAPAELVFSD